MFANLQPAPPDPILGLTEAFHADPNPDKINLGVGVYKDAAGRTPVLQCVKQAERKILEAQTNKSYKPIDGDPAYARAVQTLMLGTEHPIHTHRRAATAHTPGGTGALRVAADYLHQNHPDATVWISEPTWANHPRIFDAAGVATRTYPYFDAAENALAFDAMIDTFKQIPAGDVVLLHGCCHNPTGVDPSAQQWARIAELLAEREIVPLLDFAYQGFGDGLDEDAIGLRSLAERLPEMFVCTSYSKNFSLYNERVGSLSVITADADQTLAAMSHIKVAIRTNYSNPPAHGAAIVTTILADPQLIEQWHHELAAMRDRINAMRQMFADRLADKRAPRDFSFIKQQRGMFSFSGLTGQQVVALREKFSIYIVGSGRINVAGMSEDTMDYLCDAIVSVL